MQTVTPKKPAEDHVIDMGSGASDHKHNHNNNNDDDNDKYKRRPMRRVFEVLGFVYVEVQVIKNPFYSFFLKRF